MEQKTILITGASGSLGSAVVTKFINQKFNLVLIARKTDKIDQLVSSLTKDVKNILVLSGDVTSESSVREIISKAIDKFTHIDILIHTAGTYLGGKPLYKSDTQIWDDLFNLNAKSFFILTKILVPHMLEVGSGIIINTASKNALEVSPNSGIYSASKNVSLKLTQTLAKELVDKNIRVNAVLPSIIDSRPNRASMPDQDFSKWVKPESIANVIEFLISDQAKDITGAAIPVYGKEI